MRVKFYKTLLLTNRIKYVIIIIENKKRSLYTEYYDVAFSHKENGHTVNENIHLAVDKSSNVEYVFKQRIAPLGYKKN